MARRLPPSVLARRLSTPELPAAVLVTGPRARRAHAAFGASADGTIEEPALALRTQDCVN
ncbi:hypothetical protein [Nonomuraea maritima]|uniref:hypothetical protein n=1 Tax=Nonomuraea maritima TaxID=683260 RepID=UPI00115FBBEC|nr:hypothetical protein [Nonomuraea maritima]